MTKRPDSVQCVDVRNSDGTVSVFSVVQRGRDIVIRGNGHSHIVPPSAISLDDEIETAFGVTVIGPHVSVRESCAD